MHGVAGGVCRFTDRMPSHHLYLGWSRLALPEAKIIHMIRDPMENGWSIYKNYFDADLPFAYHQQELGRYFKHYKRLMTHWQQLFPESILQVRYENLIKDQMGETERMLDFCGLSRENACFTLALGTVPDDRPRKRSGVALWKYYERSLEPLLETLYGALSNEASPWTMGVHEKRNRYQ